MKDDQTYKLFSSIADDSFKHDRDPQNVFSMLVRTTLKYRDTLLKADQMIVTVEDVRIALDWLIPALKTGKLPDTNNMISLNLLKLWLDEIRHHGGIGYH